MKNLRSYLTGNGTSFPRLTLKKVSPLTFQGVWKFTWSPFGINPTFGAPWTGTGLTSRPSDYARQTLSNLGPPSSSLWVHTRVFPLFYRFGRSLCVVSSR